MNSIRSRDYSTLAELCNNEAEFRHLMSEWHSEKNRNLPPYGVTLTPHNVTPLDGKLVWWRCSKGHNWNESVARRVQHIRAGEPDGCIFCRTQKIRRKKTLYEHCLSVPEGEINVRKLLDEWDYDKNGSLTPGDVKPVEYRKVWWKCKEGHSWQQLIANRVKAGVGCPYCGHRRVLSGFNDLATRYPELAAEWDTEKNEKCPDQVMPMSGSRAWWKCEQGHSYQKIISNRTIQGQGCPYCAAEHRKKRSALIPGMNDLATTHPELLAEWNWDRNTISPSEVKAGSKALVWWKCAYGHEWQTPVSRRTGARKIGCPGCSGSASYQKYEAMGCLPRSVPKKSEKKSSVR